MKIAQIFLAGLLAVSVASTATGCGSRGTIELEPPASEKPKNIGTVTVTVIDHTSQPVVGAAVSLTKGEGASAVEDVETDASGKATFKNVPLAAGYVVTAEDGGIVGRQAGLVVDGESPLLVSIMLVPAAGAFGTVGGSVTDGLTGRPIDGATVSVLGVQTTATAGADGAFLIKQVPAGNPTVVAIAKGYREARLPINLRGGKLERADLKLFPAGNAARLGHTLVTTDRSVLEFDRRANLAWQSKNGAFQARGLPNGNMLVTDGAGVAEISTTSSALWRYKPLVLGRLSGPQGVSRASNGNTWIADTGNHRVIEVSPGHKIERTLRVKLHGPRSAERVEASYTTLIADTGNHRVIEVDDAGKIVWSVGDGTPAIVNHPTYATRLGNGHTLITDTGNHRVMEVNKEQRLVWMYGGKGERAACYFPNSAVRLSNGHTLIADTGNNRVIEVDKTGRVAAQITNVEQPLFAERL